MLDRPIVKAFNNIVAGTRDPLAVGHAHVDRVDAPVATRIVVAGVYDDGGRAGKEAARQLGNSLLGNRDDDDVACACGLLDRRGGRADLGGERRERFRSARVGDADLVSERPEAPCESAANVTRTGDAAAPETPP